MGGLKAQLLLSAQGNALGLGEFMPFRPVRAKALPTPLYLKKPLLFDHAFALSGRTAIEEWSNPGRCPGLKASVGLSARPRRMRNENIKLDTLVTNEYPQDVAQMAIAVLFCRRASCFFVALGGGVVTYPLQKYEQYLASKFSSVRSPFLYRSASKGNMRSRTYVWPLYKAVR